jgi:hypothetical protein
VSRSAFGEAWTFGGTGVVLGFILGPWPGTVIGAAHGGPGAVRWTGPRMTRPSPLRRCGVLPACCAA